jgi:ketosteroid isomerase-like protein
MSQENVEAVRRGYELLATGELEALTGLFSDDAELADTGGLGIAGTSAGTRRGPKGFLQSITEAQDAFEDYRVEPEDFIEADETVVVPVRISGTGRASGMRQEVHVAQLWLFREGKVVRGEVYRTVDEALEAAAMSD